MVRSITSAPAYLRQGTRCSPPLANLVCRHLDVDMLNLASAYGAKYTRYADDLTFSGDAVPPAESVAAILKQHAFKLRDDRCYIQRKGKSQFVTGLHVGDKTQPRLPRRLKRRLRLVLHYIEKFGFQAHFDRKAKRRLLHNEYELSGMILFVHSIEPTFAKKLFAQYKAGESIELDKQHASSLEEDMGDPLQC